MICSNILRELRNYGDAPVFTYYHLNDTFTCVCRPACAASRSFRQFGKDGRVTEIPEGLTGICQA